MVDWWTDEIRVTRRKDGSFSLKARKYGDGRVWLSYGIVKLRSLEAFVEGVLDCWDALSVYLHRPAVMDIIPALSALDPEFAERLRIYLATHANEGPRRGDDTSPSISKDAFRDPVPD